MYKTIYCTGTDVLEMESARFLCVQTARPLCSIGNFNLYSQNARLNNTIYVRNWSYVKIKI